MRPPLVITSGDPAGVGPEITLKAHAAVGRDIPFVVIGDAAQHRRLGGAKIAVVEAPEDWVPGALCVLDLPCAQTPALGEAALANAAGVIGGIEMAVDLVRRGAASALVTNPINKDVLMRGAGFAYPGHTEFLAALDGAARPVMMLASQDLKVVPVTIHIALSEVPGALTEALLEETLRVTHAALEADFAVPAPRLAVAGLNPHAGENGQMGTEDRDLIAPLLARLRQEGMNVAGPLSADTMFHARARAGYDAALCMYHDQALIPIKTLDFDRGVNVTLGLSFVRTSPDHGTAFDIAGKGIANPSSLIEAIRLADQMASARMAGR